MPVTQRPDMQQFMTATGLDPVTAAQLLYGNVGSNTDKRDWSSIMSSGDPAASARAATAYMYNGAPSYLSPNAVTPTMQVGGAGNYSVNVDPSSGNRSYQLLDGSGHVLFGTNTLQQLQNQALNFGYSWDGNKFNPTNPTWTPSTQYTPNTPNQPPQQAQNQPQNPSGGLGGLGGVGNPQQQPQQYQQSQRQPTNGFQGWGMSNPFRATV